jgi:hypothetical protein
MEAKDLIFYNKEGHPINTQFNEELQYWNSSMFFDKNSTDTYKTLGIYLFEKIQPSQHTFQAYLDQYQVFNSDGFYTWPIAKGSQPVQITDIKKSNNSSLFNTKWIYGNNIGNNIRSGDWCYFQGLNGYHSTDFDTITSYTQIFQVLFAETGRILIKTTQANNITLPTFTAGSTKLVIPINILEVDNNIAGFNTYFYNKIYKDKKLSYVPLNNSDNTGIYTIQDTTITKQKNITTFSPTLFSPTIIPALPDKIKVTIDFFTDRFQLSNGITNFAPVINTNAIQIPYVPFFLKIGDQIQAEAKTTALFGPNTASFTITAIDKVNNLISVTPAPTAQTIDCYIYKSSNELIIEQEIVLDNNNQYSLPVTYWTLVQNWKTILNNYDIIIDYDVNTDSLIFKPKYSDIYFLVKIDRYLNGSNAILSTFTGVSTILNVYPHWIKEELISQEIINKDTSIYNRQIVFNVIDNVGLNIVINNKLYAVDFDTTVANTTGDWITQFSSELTTLGINVSLSTTTVLNDTINIISDFANRKIITELRMGDFSTYYVPRYTYIFNNIKSQLLINVNGKDYIVPFSISDANTVTNWVTAYAPILKTLNILVTNIGSAEILFSTLDPEIGLVITYNIGYISKSGDASIFITNLSPISNGSVLVGNEIKTTLGLYNFLDYYSSGQKISINGALKLLQNTSYNIIDLNSNTIFLSYQGPFWQQGTPLFNLDINSDYYIRYPMQGINGINNRSKIRWTWKNTQTDELFLYDFSGSQLTPINSNFPVYNGPIPLCGQYGEFELKLNKLPNDRQDYISDPTKQQTVFDVLSYNLPYLDDTINPNIEPSPMQVFIGYNQKLETFVKSRLYCELIEDLSFNLITQTNGIDNLWNFSDNYLEVTSPLINFDWTQYGFRKGQLIQIASKDVNIDGRNLSILSNNGNILRISQVLAHKLIFEETVITETSFKSIAKTTPPYYDNSGNAFTENRHISVTITVVPQLLAYFDIYGESEDEDIRHKINLDNRNLNILKLQDLFIFKSVDIKEQGIDWILLNRKRKELLEIYPQIFNNVSSYKSIIQAINFFGYNDLTFTEYFQNINPDSNKFGHLFNMDLLNIFDKSVEGWSYSNLAIDNLKNQGYKKTNLFSLNYRITDNDGNFIDAYSQDEVKIKLTGLKKWLTENLIPIGAKITDIDGKYIQPYTWHIKHDTYKTQNFRVEEYSVPVNFTVSGYNLPISIGSNQYNITVEPYCQVPIEWYSYTIKTFQLPQWITSNSYLIGVKVYHLGVIYIANTNIAFDEEPGISNNWIISSIDTLSYSQIITGYKYDLSNISFSVNNMIDPHFLVELDWHSGYACNLMIKKAYSVIPNFFDNFIV